METITETPKALVTTKEIVTGKMNIALTKAELGIQSLIDEAANIVLNEDNIDKAKALLDKQRKAAKIIGDVHTEIKAIPLKECQVIDESKRNMLEQLSSVFNPFFEKYTALCREVDDKKRKQEDEKRRKEIILQGIDSNMINFSSRIANCTTNDDLLAVERSINLEKSYKNKYQEFLDTAIEKYNSLTSLLTLQKTRVKELEKLEEDRKKAEKDGNDQKLLELNEKQFVLESKIEENKITVQETAIKQATETVKTTEPEIVFANVSTRRKTWTWEIADIQKTVKTMPSWTKIETVDEKIDEFMKASKAQWQEDGEESVIIHGIRFFIQKTY
jgi:hypothetical protein